MVFTSICFLMIITNLSIILRIKLFKRPCNTPHSTRAVAEKSAFVICKLSEQPHANTQNAVVILIASMLHIIKRI